MHWTWKLAVILTALMMTFPLVAADCGGDDDDDDDSSDDDTGDDDTADDDTADDDTVDDDDTGDDDTTDDDTVDDDDTGDDDTGDDDVEVPIVQSSAFLDRCATFIDNCATNTGGRYEQICALEKDQSINEDLIRNYIAGTVEPREDTADFGMTGFMRMMYLYEDKLDEPLRTEIEDAFLGFKYWPDEAGPDEMVFWSENHHILFHSLELLAGQKWRNETFTNEPMTGQDHIDKVLPRLHRWLDWRLLHGFSEWHSNVYYNEDAPPLLNLVDFAEDADIREKAKLVLDMLLLDMAFNSKDATIATAHGRTYPDKITNRSSDSMSGAQSLWFGNSDKWMTDNGGFTETHLCTSAYAAPEAIVRVANATPDEFLNFQRDGINIADADDYGLTYTDPDDVLFWWSMGSYAAPDIIEGTFDTLDLWTMWDGAFFGDLNFLEPIAQSPIIKTLITLLRPISQGPALEELNIVTYRTPEYQLSSAQDYNPGYWGAQTAMWSGLIDPETSVYTSIPGGAGDYLSTDWTGGFLPRIGQVENVAVLLYGEESFFLDNLLRPVFNKGYAHAYFPRGSFDEWSQSDGWTFGRKGDAYVALYASAPTRWADGETSDYELIADTINLAWIVEMGSAAQNGSYEAFKADILAADLSVDGLDVTYDSPSVGELTYGWTGRLQRDGKRVNQGSFKRFDNMYIQHEWGDTLYTLNIDELRLELDVENLTRTMYESGS